MGHGLGAIKEVGLHRFARRFAAAGHDVVAFDHRGFGESTGGPRQVVDIAAQQEDWHAAIAFARALPGVARIVLWGTSYALPCGPASTDRHAVPSTPPARCLRSSATTTRSLRPGPQRTLRAAPPAASCSGCPVGTTWSTPRAGFDRAIAAQIAFLARHACSPPPADGARGESA